MNRKDTKGTKNEWIKGRSRGKHIIKSNRLPLRSLRSLRFFVVQIAFSISLCGLCAASVRSVFENSRSLAWLTSRPPYPTVRATVRGV